MKLYNYGQWTRLVKINHQRVDLPYHPTLLHIERNYNDIASITYTKNGIITQFFIRSQARFIEKDWAIIGTELY